MEENKTFKAVAYIGVFVFICAVCWYLLSDVSNNGGTAIDVREQFDRVGEEQRNAENALVDVERGLDASSRIADEVSERIDDAENRTEQVKAGLDDCARLVEDSERRIEESKSILQGIRERAGQSGK